MMYFSLHISKNIKKFRRATERDSHWADRIKIFQRDLRICLQFPVEIILSIAFASYKIKNHGQF